MKILFLGINARYTHSNLGLYYLRNCVIDSHHTWEIFETSINSDILETIRQILSKNPDALCLSVYIWNTEYVYKFLQLLKKILPELIVIAGGPEITYSNEYIERMFPYIDYTVQGPGENALKYLIQNDFKLQDRVIREPAIPFKDIAFPYLPEDIELLKNKYVYYEASRGCPFKCSFCLSSREDAKLEYRDLEQVKLEIIQLISLQPRLIKFVDRSFNADRRFAREIWKYLIELNPGITFHFEIKPDLLEDEDIELLRKAPSGLIQFEIGLQSTHQATLQAINRANSFSEIMPYLVRINELENIHTHLDLIAGLPYDSVETFSQSFNQAISTLPRYLQLGFLKVLPGTLIAEQSADFGFSSMPYPPYQILSTKWMSFTDLMSLEKFDHYFNIFFNSEKMTSTLHYLLKQLINPFNFFRSLFHFCEIKGFEPKKDYYEAFSRLAEYITIELPEMKDYLFDSLLFDWCLNVYSPRIPRLLQNPISSELKDSIYILLRTSPESLPEALCSAKPYLKKAIFAKFSNIDFIDNKLMGKSRLIVYQDEGLKMVLW